MTAALAVTIPGTPRPQGSLKIIPSRTGQPFAKNSDTTIAHRNHCATVIAGQWQDRAPITGAVAIRATFTFARPKAHHGTGRNSDRLKPSAPAHHTQYPDTDKLVRLIGDALVAAGVLADDSLIILWRAEKAWTTGRPGTRIEVHTIEQETP